MQQSMALLIMQITFSLLHPPSFLPKSGPNPVWSRNIRQSMQNTFNLLHSPSFLPKSGPERPDRTSEIRAGLQKPWSDSPLQEIMATKVCPYSIKQKKTIEHCIQKNLAFVTEVSIFSENVHSCVHFRIPMRVSVAKRKNILYTRVNSCFFCLIALGNDVLLHSYTTNICYRTYKIKLKMYTAVYIFNYYN